MPENLSSVRQPITLEKIDQGIIPRPVVSFMDYYEKRPFEVSLVFPQVGRGPDIIWIFARDLLVDGVADQTPGNIVGEGDVRLESVTADTVGIHLLNTDSRTIFQAPRKQITVFLDRTIGIVPLGTESMDEEISKDLRTL